MKHFLTSLMIFWFVVGAAACTPTVEPEVAFVPTVLPSVRDTTTSAALSASAPPPALVHVTTQPTRAIHTPTAVPTETPTSEPTAVLPVASSRETPTNVVTAVPPTSPTTQFTQTIVITPTMLPTNTLPNAQTPTPGWYHYASDVHGLMLQYPMHWQPALDHPYGLDGDDGFLRLYATNSQDNLLLNACQDMAMGTAVPIDWLLAAGQEACLVTAGDGREATLIVRFPELHENIVPGVAYAFLVLQADPVHMPGFVQTLYFMPVVPAPTP